MVHQGRKAGARSPKGIRVSKRISKKVKKNSKKDEAVAKRLDFEPEPMSDCLEPEAEPIEQPDLSGDADTMEVAKQNADETQEVLPPIDAEDADLDEEEKTEEKTEENTEEKTEEPLELTEEEKIAASKRDLVEFFESSSFALAMQARLLSKKPDHELNYGCLLSTLSAGSSLPRSVLEHITLVWKKDNKWIRAWLANELCDPTESEKKDELTDNEAALIDFYATLSSDTKEAATSLCEKPDAEFNFGLMCSTLTTGPLPAEVSTSLAMKWKTDQSWIREWLSGKLSTA
jgi:hypothetical protein